jgi:hypothetical protein
MEKLEMYEMIEISGGILPRGGGYNVSFFLSFIEFCEGIKEGFNDGYTRAIQ